MVHQLRSPVQFGQATQVDFGSGVSNVVAGVTNAHLANDFFIEYSHIINRHTLLTTGLSLSIPGAGITSALPGNVPLWTGGFVNVVVGRRMLGCDDPFLPLVSPAFWMPRPNQLGGHNPDIAPLAPLAF
jgi:hypothetical protein